ncbi:trimeric intracellular cation channel family protein [Streptomyces nitrosporeus]|uniref:trimeric intracellular cation channel family protein n=1 Tax=Streptomyces nitrosporeus TaxID=28894 RepID=UPI0039A27AA5
MLASRPDHYKNFTVAGILLMALLGGIGGGVSRDIMVGRVPAALTNSSYIVLCLLAGFIGYHLAYSKGQLFREGLFQFVTSFALPWYATVGAQTGVDVGLPVLGSLALAVVGPTTGRFLIDVSCGAPPKQFVRGEWFVAIATLTGAVWIALDQAGLPRAASAPLAFLVGFTVRLTALYRGWEEPPARPQCRPGHRAGGGAAEPGDVRARRRAFPKPPVVPDDAPAPIDQASLQRHRQAAATEAAALRRARDVKGGREVAVPQRLDQTA